MFELFLGLLKSINDTAFSDTIRESEWVFPTLETIHVIAIVLMFGSIARLDLRLTGIVARNRPVTEVSDELLPWTWVSFVVATIFGLLLFAGKPVIYTGIAFFDLKMILILLAGLNMLYFQHVTFKTVSQWNDDPLPPASVRFAGGLSLAFWLTVVLCGRLIGFV